jgi:hypothetical protein
MNIEHYFLGRLDELRTLAKRGDPWVFLCASSFLEYLARIWTGKATSQTDYKRFLEACFFRVCPAYARFKYDSGETDLARQMYHVLRCGIVHSFSLVVDKAARGKRGRDRSILLAHRASGLKHLKNYVDGKCNPKLDAAIFVAEDFVEDIGKVTKSIFDEAKEGSASGKAREAKIRKWVETCPPIALLELSKPQQASGAQFSTFTNPRAPSG